MAQHDEEPKKAGRRFSFGLITVVVSLALTPFAARASNVPNAAGPSTPAAVPRPGAQPKPEVSIARLREHAQELRGRGVTRVSIAKQLSRYIVDTRTGQTPGAEVPHDQYFTLTTSPSPGR